MAEMVNRRLEDPPLITGRGRYLDDMSPPGCLHAGFVRSLYAHATVGTIEAGAARAIDGVVGVYTGTDIGLDRQMPNMHPDPSREPGVQGYPLAPEEACYVGEPVAVVVAEDPYVLADALSEVFVDHEPLPATIDLARALDPDAAPVHSGSETNLATTLRGSYGDVDAVFASAPHTAPIDLYQHRGAVASMETRGVLADFTDEPTMWSSTQSPHGLQNLVSEYLGVRDLRVVTPDVGGGFGPKGSVYPEEYVVPALARTLGRPVKWVESRREHFLTTNQQRDQIHRLEVAFDDSGVLLGLRGRVIHDNGAYVPYGYLLPLTGLRLLPGPYVLPAMDLTIDVVYTNLVPTSPIRGAARPNAVFAIERAVDAIARGVGLTQAEVRHRNYAPAEVGYEVSLPSRTGAPIRYDGGDYRRTLDLALEVADSSGFAQRRTETEKR
ncbi:MAG: molybdopterin-dependent oxidoreductase, partial [Acidimicrobiia bacterium]|nr:molybdopterin-dependent oxidoreductase [Acidimicrobiia bacterium]